MSNLVELLTGTKLGADLRDGTKFFAESRGGEAFALASRNGTVMLWARGYEGQYLNLQPTKKKNKSEAELQGIWLSQTGDLLYAATAVDILAVNTSTRTVAWEYQQKRQWGFLASIPQGGYLDIDDNFTTFYSSGEVVQIDRQSRVLRSESFGHAPRIIVKHPQASFALGSDGHVTWKWDAEKGFESREIVIRQPAYSLQLSGDGGKLAIRATNKVLVYDTESFEQSHEFACDPGLPQFALNGDGSFIANLSESRVVFRDLTGDIVGVFEFQGEFPVSIHASKHLGQVVVGMRSGTAYSVPWPQ